MGGQKEREWRLVNLQKIISPNDLADLIYLVETGIIPRSIGKELLADWFWHGLKELKHLEYPQSLAHLNSPVFRLHLKGGWAAQPPATGVP